VEPFIDDALLGELVVKLLLSRDLELGVQFLALIKVGLVVLTVVTARASHWLVYQLLQS
jgi:hypothetical protein